MSEIQENIAEMFFSKLKVSQTPGVLLAQFYGAITAKEVGRFEVGALNRLIKIYGRSSVFFSIIDASRLKDLTDFPVQYIHAVCKAKLQKMSEADSTVASMISLDKRIEDIENELAKVKRIDPEKATKYLEGNK